MSINSWGSELPVDVPHGGTGNSSLTAHTLLIGDGTNPIVLPSPALDGQLFIASSSGPPVAATWNGVSDQIEVNLSSGACTLALAPDAIIPGTEALTLPTASIPEPPTGIDGYLRYNSTDATNERFEDGNWEPFLPGGNDGFRLLHTASLSGATSYIIDIGAVAFPMMIYISSITSTGTNSLSLRACNAGGTPFTSGYNAFTYTISGTSLTPTTDNTLFPLVPSTATAPTNASGWLSLYTNGGWGFQFSFQMTWGASSNNYFGGGICQAATAAPNQVQFLTTVNTALELSFYGFLDS